MVRPAAPTLETYVRRVVTGYRLVLGLLLVILTAVVFGNSWGVFQTDIKPEVYLAPGEMLPHYLSAWTSTPYLGSPNFNVGLLPVLVVTATLRAVGMSPEIAFKVYHLALWVLAAWGTSRLLRSLVPTASRWAGLVAGAAYIANPYTISAGSTLAIALPLALLPWMLLALVRALRAPRSWAWPAGFALAFFAMSGMNAAVVPVLQLLLVIPVALTIKHEQSLPWSAMLRVIGRCAVLVVLLSLYWLVPAVAAAGTGGQIIAGSETLEGIAKVSSLTEVLRGVGMWAIYGRSDSGAWVPQFSAYVATPIFILLTALWPAAAMASLRWVPRRIERLVALTVGLVAVIMVGLFPVSGSSPFAWLLARAFDLVPPLLAFRTTNKIGAGLALFFAIALGLAAVRVLPRVLRVPGVAPIAGAMSLITVFAWCAPALTNNLYISPVDVPGYWRSAADRVDRGSPGSRVLLLPGQTRSSYRWSLERPDDLPNSLITRDAIIPETTPNTSAPGANYLAALDDTLQSGAAQGADISTFARYLGADQVLLRHDIRWESNGGARPGVSARALSEDPGLSGLSNYGQPGENAVSPSIAPTGDEGMLPPLQLYGVGNARGMVTAGPTTNQVVVAGDAWSIPSMTAAGVLKDAPGFRYAQDLDVADLGAALEADDSRFVITDTNQRRAAITNRLVAGQGPVLPPDAPLGVTRTLGQDPDDQSVLLTEGVTVKASAQGAAFFELPYGVGENAVDGDPRTSWLFGDFRRAVGTTLTMKLPRPTQLGTIGITPTALGGVKIKALEVRAGDVTRTVDMPATGAARVDLGGVRTDRVTLTVRSITGEGYSLVGISEIDLGSPSLVARRSIRTPQTLTKLYGELPQAGRAAFAKRPLDVLLRRVSNSASTTDDSERQLSRDFTLPDDRTFTASARVRVDGDVEPVYDRLLSRPDGWTMTSSAYDFYNPKMRASQASDGDPRTAWAPSSDMQDSWWQVEGPERDVRRVVVDQRSAAEGRDQTQFASEVTISVDGTEVAREEVARGRSTITLPRGTRGRTVRMTISQVSGRLQGRPARFTSIDTGSDVVVRERAGASPCITVATLDGQPLRMRPSQAGAPLAAGDESGTTWEACGSLPMAWGDHEVRPVSGLTLDDLQLRDRRGLKTPRPVPPPVLRTSMDFDLGMTVEAGPSFAPYVLSIGQGYDPRWRATVDGKDLGRPVVVDGYATGWLVSSTTAHTIHIDFGPQRSANVALLVSLVGVLLCSVLLGRELWRRRRPVDDTPTPEVPLLGQEHVDVVDPLGHDRTGSREAADDDAAPRHASGSLRTRLSSRVGAEVGLVLVATFFTGVGGLLGALAAVALARAGRATPTRLILGGALLVLAATAVYVYVGRDVWPRVDADVVSASLVPHHIAAAGLVWAVAGALWRSVEKKASHDPPAEH